jgi:hypothetical protein
MSLIALGALLGSVTIEAFRATQLGGVPQETRQSVFGGKGKGDRQRIASNNLVKTWK